MTEYMEKFLEPFRHSPYEITREGGNQHRITNTFSGISAVIRGYRGEVIERVPNLDDELGAYQWKRVSPERLKDELGIYEERGKQG